MPGTRNPIVNLQTKTKGYCNVLYQPFFECKIVEILCRKFNHFLKNKSPKKFKKFDSLFFSHALFQYIVKKNLIKLCFPFIFKCQIWLNWQLDDHITLVHHKIEKKTLVHINPKPPYQNGFGRGEKKKRKEKENLRGIFEIFQIQKISKMLENYSNLHQRNKTLQFIFRKNDQICEEK